MGTPARRDTGLLVRSPLFDVGWYARISGKDRPRAAAARHYLAHGRAAGLSPHPLFDPAWFADQNAASLRGRDPFILYLTDRASRKTSPHPLFDMAAYVVRAPAAKQHPLGPLGHYVEIGAAQGVPPNDWYVPDVTREPRGLLDWIDARGSEWAARWRPEAPGRDEGADLTGGLARANPEPEPASAGSPRVSVVLVVGDDRSLVPDMVETVRAQTVSDWELLVVGHHDDDGVAVLLEGVLDRRIRFVRRERGGGEVAALAVGLAEARGVHVAWIRAGDQWEPRRLERALAELARPGVDVVHDVVELAQSAGAEGRAARSASPAVRWSPERAAMGWHPGLAALIVRRTLALDAGGFDPTVHAAAEHDFFLNVAARTRPVLVPHVGVRGDRERRRRHVGARPPRERPPLDLDTVATWHDVVLSHHLVPWDELLERDGDPGLVSVVIPTSGDWRPASKAVESVVAAARTGARSVQVLVVDGGSSLTTSVVLASLPRRFETVRVLDHAIDHGFALGANLAMPAVEGEVVVFLDPDVEVEQGWLEPLVDALGERDVLGAQSLVLDAAGTIETAGVAFPASGGMPHALLHGFPRHDAAGLAGARLSAPAGGAVAFRRRDFLRMRGFDPLFRDGLEDVDLGLRMVDQIGGHVVVCPASAVARRGTGGAGRMAPPLPNRRIFLDRWGYRTPGNDAALWNRVGYEVVGYDVAPDVEDRRLAPPLPVLRRRAAITPVAAERPALRWAIKNPAPNDPSAEFWGDTHFARQLAAALRELGQEVVIDHRPAFDRPTGRFDDVVLVLRGVAPFRPRFGQVNLGWLISHPEMLARGEATSYDRLFAASACWADEMSRAWGIRVDPLLQATDPATFNPDRARPDTGHPVLFVGSSRRKLRPIVRDAIAVGMPLAIFGREWNGLVPDGYVKAEYLANDAVGAAYRAAGLVLNDHWEDMRTAGFLSNRLFDAVASGARVVTDDVAGLGTMFGRSVQVARDEADLTELAALNDLDSVFGEDAERRTVAAHVHGEHSFAARARTLLDTALEVRARVTERTGSDRRRVDVGA